MKIFAKTAKTLAAAGIATATLAAVPASAQVNGIATSVPEAVIVRSAARQAAYQQIAQTYAAQLQQIQALRTETQTLQRSLDTNGDNQISDAELQAGQAVVTQVQQKEQQIAQIGQPIGLAQTYVIEQLLTDYQNAQQQVVQAKGIQIMLSQDAIQYAPSGVDVTSDIVAALDQRLPTVQATPPANWRPRRESLALQQAVQQILVGVAQQQAAQQAQQAQPAAPSGR
ncbi:OmpH family outer membrane protein [Altererythrobacter sp. MTPC7]|uniref:OmpH family outer membrane protein n=1 Tax=Altererythrobacter sp. MTPC7 TaxID=3056567 RepID=UPI0036F38C0B